MGDIMVIIGFSFTKMNVERKTPISGKISISNNVSIQKVEEHKLSLSSGKESSLKFIFEFSSNYKPEIGKIELLGEVIYMDDEKKVKDIIKSWNKDKKIPKEIMSDILNNVLVKCNIQALILSQYMNLPPPIPLPKVQAQEE